MRQRAILPRLALELHAACQKSRARFTREDDGQPLHGVQPPVLHGELCCAIIGAGGCRNVPSEPEGWSARE